MWWPMFALFFLACALGESLTCAMAAKTHGTSHKLIKYQYLWSYSVEIYICA